MPINSDKLHLWKADAARAVDFYKKRYSCVAPAYRHSKRAGLTREALAECAKTSYLERQQYAMLRAWLLSRGYNQIASDMCCDLEYMPMGSFSFWPATASGNRTTANALFHCVVNPAGARKVSRSIITKAKLSGSLASSIRSAKKDAKKFAASKAFHEDHARFMLLLCGCFDGYYLGPQAAEGIDWIWQHRLDEWYCLGSVSRL